MGPRSVWTLQPTAWPLVGRMPKLGRAKALPRSRTSRVVALRVPERVSAQLAAVFPKGAPRLYVHEGARQALERRLAYASTRPVSVAITDNRHNIISHGWQNGVLKARVHHMFLDAPPGVTRALIRYITEADPHASERLGRYIASRGERLIRRGPPRKLVTRGQHHDLLAIARDVNERYFDGEMDVLITWGRRVRSKAPRKSIKLGSFIARERLVRVHPVLDRGWVPRYFVAYVVYHEMLHRAFPARTVGGRRLVHPPEFREHESEFRHFERALRWESAHYARLLRA